MPDPKVLNEWLTQEEAVLKRLIADRERLEAEIAKHQQVVSHVRTLLTLQGKGPMPKQMVLHGRFSNVRSLADAAISVLREQKRAELGDIGNALQAGGFDFRDRNPKRTTFITLLNMSHSRNGTSPVKRTGRTQFALVEEGG